MVEAAEKATLTLLWNERQSGKLILENFCNQVKALNKLWSTFHYNFIIASEILCQCWGVKLALIKPTEKECSSSFGLIGGRRKKSSCSVEKRSFNNAIMIVS